MKRPLWIVTAVLLLVALGCGRGNGGGSQSSGTASDTDGKDSTATTPEVTEAANQAGAASGTEPISPATAGTITGMVTLEGAPAALKPIDMSAAPACVEANASPVFPPSVLMGKNGALANVLVYVKNGLGNRQFEAPRARVVLDQKACMYEPHVVALMVGQKLQVHNDDPTTHNVHVIGRTSATWNQSQPPDGAAIEESFVKPEMAVTITCSLHPWMRAVAFVFDHPYFAVTSRNGKFELKNLPPGIYTVEAWQELYGTLDQTVTIGTKQSKVISFSFQTQVKTRNRDIGQ